MNGSFNKISLNLKDDIWMEYKGNNVMDVNVNKWDGYLCVQCKGTVDLMLGLRWIGRMDR